MAARLLRYAIAFLAAVPLVSRGGDECTRRYLDLRRLIGREEYERAFEISAELLGRFPEYPPLYEAVAELGLYTRQWERSEEVFAERIRQGIGVPLALYGYAALLASKDDHAGAIQFCMEAIERGLTYSGVYKELAYAYEKAYGDGEALSMLVRLSRRFPRSAGYHYGVAVELWSLGDFKPVVSRLKEAVALDPAEPRYADALAVAELHLAYSRRKAEGVEARRALAQVRGDIAGSQFLVSSLLSDQIYAGDHRRRDTVLQASTAEASEFGFLRWLGWNLQRCADMEGLASRLPPARQLSHRARTFAFKANDLRLAMVATQRISSAFLEEGVLDSALHYARLRWSLSSRSNSANDFVSGIGKIALILFHMGHFQLANEYCIEALAAADSRSVDEVTLAEIETTAGLIQERLGNNQQALRHHRLARKALGVENVFPYCLAANSGNLGRMGLSQGRLVEAGRFFREELLFAKQLCYPYEIVNALVNLGDLSSAQGRSDHSEALYLKALKTAKSIGSCLLEYEVLSRLAKVTENSGKIEESLRWYTEVQGAGMVCILNGKVGFPEFSQALKDKAHLELSNDNLRRGLATLALTKLIEAYPYIGTSFFSSNPRDEWLQSNGLHEVEARLVSAVAGLQEQIQNKTHSLSSRSALLLAMTDVVDARIAISQLARSRMSSSPSTWPSIAERLDTFGLQHYLRDRNSCLVQYLVRDNGVTALCMNGDSVHYGRLLTTREQLERQIRQASPVLREEGIKVPLLHPSIASFDIEILHELYSILLEPFRHFTERANRLIFLQDGLLQNLPFEALVTGPGANGARPVFLIEQHEVSYCYALGQLLPQLPSNPSDLSVLAVADPYIAEGGQIVNQVGENPMLKYLRSRQKGELPSARNEGDAIRNLFGSRARLLIGRTASKDEIMRALPSSRLIHLATHSVTDCGDPEFTGLAFGTTKSTRADGILRLYELRTVELNADLAVLSGCRTARGDETNLTWSPTFAFWAAGARTVIGTLWDVQDEKTRDLMCEFYAAIGSGLGASAGLRQAKLAEISKGNRDPLLWASHVVIGDPNVFEGLDQSAALSDPLQPWLAGILISSIICSLFSIAGLIAVTAGSIDPAKDR